MLHAVNHLISQKPYRAEAVMIGVQALGKLRHRAVTQLGRDIVGI